MPIEIILGDITQMRCDAIVNSANPSLLAGGGVCGAIHAAAGPELERACLAIGRIEPGEAVVTHGYGLCARYVIHAVAPRWIDGARGEPETLALCYRAIFNRVAELSVTSVALPSIGTGIYRVPLEVAARIAMDAMLAHNRLDLAIQMVCFDTKTAEAYRAALEVSAVAD